MAQVLERDLPEETVTRRKERVAEAGRGPEAEARGILDQAARPSEEQRKRGTPEILRRIRAWPRSWRPGEPTAGDMIREDRASR